MFFFFFFQAEDGIRDVERSRGLGDVYKRQGINAEYMGIENMVNNVQSIEMRLAELASLEEKLVESENQYLEVTAKIGICNTKHCRKYHRRVGSIFEQKGKKANAKYKSLFSKHHNRTIFQGSVG
eukprot:TRINITY_DN6425_c0_g1_i1.p1 TRINITY_DN6425_c0_g1~~TRINITY_DN6425_c0_g1_i1.p1  ORF type:complete len:125 (-),score=31.80 TRINITY_DN6425_c0_g1_i1:243-617(-)